MEEQPERLCVTVPEAAQMIGISERHAWELARRGKMPSIMLGSRRVVPLEALRRWLDDQVAAGFLPEAIAG